MLAALTVDQESDLYAALCYWFSLAELEDLAFDLGLGFDLYGLESKEELVRGMLRAVSIMGRLGCLVDRFAALAPEADLSFAPSPLPACIKHRKLQVLLPGNLKSIRLSELKRELASGYKVPDSQVSVMGAAGPRSRVLVSVPDNRPSVAGRRTLRRYQGASVRPFERLDGLSRGAWRWAVQRFPPELSADRLTPAVQWGEARGQVRRRALASRLTVALGMVAVGAAGYLLVSPWAPAIRLSIEWGVSSLIAWLMPWVQFLGSVALSAAGLAWSTALFFGLLAVGLRALPLWLDRASRQQPDRAAWLWLRDGARAAVSNHPRLVGTLLNLLSSALALGLFSAVTRQPLDEWDLGIQGVIAVLMELIVLGVILRVRLPSAARP